MTVKVLTGPGPGPGCVPGPGLGPGCVPGPGSGPGTERQHQAYEPTLMSSLMRLLGWSRPVDDEVYIWREVWLPEATAATSSCGRCGNFTQGPVSGGHQHWNPTKPRESGVLEKEAAESVPRTLIRSGRERSSTWCSQDPASELHFSMSDLKAEAMKNE